MRLAALLLFLPALAQAFPARPVSIVVPYPPGSTSDLIPRAIAPLMSQSLGVPVIVENRPGAGGNVGAAAVARGDASGHQVLMAPSAILATNQWLYREPGSLAFASGGSGTTSHLCGELLKSSASVDLLHVPYKGPAPALQDVIAGRVPLMCDNLSNVLPHVRSGRLKAVALTSMKRHAQAPEVPTANESGLPGFEVGVWYGFAVASATPKAVVEKLNAEIARALRDPKIAERLGELGLAIVADSPQEFARFVAAESERMRKLVQASGARVD